jgi:hypothetical protein
MWIPHVGEQCPFLHPLASLSDLGGHGVFIRADVNGLQDARSSHMRFERALAFFPSGEYSFDRLSLSYPVAFSRPSGFPAAA